MTSPPRWLMPCTSLFFTWKPACSSTSDSRSLAVRMPWPPTPQIRIDLVFICRLRSANDSRVMELMCSPFSSTIGDGLVGADLGADAAAGAQGLVDQRLAVAVAADGRAAQAQADLAAGACRLVHGHGRPLGLAVEQHAGAADHDHRGLRAGHLALQQLADGLDLVAVDLVGVLDAQAVAHQLEDVDLARLPGPSASCPSRGSPGGRSWP